MNRLLRIITQFLIIFAIWRLGEFLNRILSIPIPGSIIGMMILLLLLESGIIKETHISDAGDLFLHYLPFFFVPTGVAILGYLDIVEGLWIQLLAVLLISGILVMLVTGWTVQYIIRKKSGSNQGEQYD